jgi:hypothetical protein
MDVEGGVPDGMTAGMAAEGAATSGMVVKDSTGQGDATVEREHAKRGARPARIARLLPFAGPLLIVCAVMVVLHAYAFQGLISIRHPDLLPFWFPTYCYLGKSLAAGHIPAWNPHVMGGVPFAADPQSGWGYVPAMAMFAALPCSVAIRWIIVFHPLVAGLALYGFLRSESLSRTASTVGGLSLALAIADSAFAVYLPFAAMFAWTAVLLWTASRLLHSSRWSSRIVWLIGAALAWGQLAAAHLSQGLIVGTGVLVSYVAIHLVVQLWRKERSTKEAVALGGLMLIALPLVNLAFFLPRIFYLPETTLGRGYRTLQILRYQLAGSPRPPFALGGNAPTFPLSLSAAGGAYLGAVVLGLAFAGWRARRLGRLWLSFVAYVVGAYLLSLHLTAKVLAPNGGSGIIGSFYGHGVHRLSWGLVLALPVLGAAGVEAWRERSGPGLRLAMLTPAILVWAVAPIALDLHREHLLLPVVGGLVALAVLGLVAIRPGAVMLIPVVLAAELSASGLMVKPAPCCDDRIPPPKPHVLAILQAGDRANVGAAAYARPGPIVHALQSGDQARYLSIDPGILWGSGVRRAPRNWPFMGTQRSMMFGIQEGQGYNPAQLMRYWTFVRQIQREPLVYNAAYFDKVEPLALNLLQVSYVIQSSADPPVIVGSTRVATEGSFALYSVPFAPPRASVVESWEIVGSADLARDRVLGPDFFPGTEVVLEKDPGIGASPSPPVGGVPVPIGSARYVAEGDQAARVEVDASRASLVLVRNVYERNWHASVDGRPAPVLAADSLIQAIPVSAGHHVIRLSYEDPTVGYGLLGSALALTALLAAAALLSRREHRVLPPS